MAEEVKFGDFWKDYNRGIDRELGVKIKGAFESGIEAALNGEKVSTALKEKLGVGIKKTVVNAMSAVMFGSGTGGGGESEGISALMSGGKGGGVFGGMFKKLFGSEMSFFGGGAGGVVGGLLGIASMTGAFDKRYKPEMSGVDPLFGSGPRVIGGGLETLYGSDVFERAAFSGRNVSGEMLRKFADTRMSPELTVNIKPSREFDAISEEKWVRSSFLNSIAGVPRRTNFNHG